jgi:hypothetical protein
VGNDVHYILVFSAFFLLLGLIAPLINNEFDTEYSENEYELPDGESSSPTTIFQIILNILVLPFWTFGFEPWINLWILLPLRIPYMFVIARNIWVGGGG